MVWGALAGLGKGLLGAVGKGLLGGMGLGGKGGFKNLLPKGLNLLSKGVQQAFGSGRQYVENRANQLGRNVQNRAYEAVGKVKDRVKQSRDYVKDGVSSGQAFFNSQAKKFQGTVDNAASAMDKFVGAGQNAVAAKQPDLM